MQQCSGARGGRHVSITCRPPLPAASTKHRAPSSCSVLAQERASTAHTVGPLALASALSCNRTRCMTMNPSIGSMGPMGSMNMNTNMNMNSNANFNKPSATNGSGAAPLPGEQKLQWKIQILLHINSMLIKKAQETRALHTNGSVPSLAALSKDQLDQLLVQYTKRIHCNLHTISQMNQGNLAAKPAILDPPVNPLLAPNASVQDRQQDMLVKMYLLMNRMFQLW